MDDLYAAILDNKYYMIGELLKINWELKKSLSQGITSGEIDRMVDIAMKSGATGCKIAGAGGGGFLLSYVDLDKQKKFLMEMKEFRELPFMIDPFGEQDHL